MASPARRPHQPASARRARSPLPYLIGQNEGLDARCNAPQRRAVPAVPAVPGVLCLLCLLCLATCTLVAPRPQSAPSVLHEAAAGGAETPGSGSGSGGGTAQQQVAPNIVHFIFGMAADFGGKPFGLVQYLAVRSAAERLRPDAVYLHYVHMPSGLWFDRARQFLTLNPVAPITEVFGQPLANVAHSADVLRLRVLNEMGGIYMDMDVVSVSAMDELRRHEFVLGLEGDEASAAADPHFRRSYTEPTLCNAVVVSKPGARFIARWFAQYRRFVDTHWAFNSVVVPKQLAKIHPDEVTVVGSRSFFAPLWTNAGLRTLFKPDAFDPAYFDNADGAAVEVTAAVPPDAAAGGASAEGEKRRQLRSVAQAPPPRPRQFAVHLWDKFSYARYIRDLTVHDVMTVNTTFNWLVRPYVREFHDDAVSATSGAAPGAGATPAGAALDEL